MAFHLIKISIFGKKSLQNSESLNLIKCQHKQTLGLLGNLDDVDVGVFPQDSCMVEWLSDSCTVFQPHDLPLAIKELFCYAHLKIKSCLKFKY